MKIIGEDCSPCYWSWNGLLAPLTANCKNVWCNFRTWTYSQISFKSNVFGNSLFHIKGRCFWLVSIRGFSFWASLVRRIMSITTWHSYSFFIRKTRTQNPVPLSYLANVMITTSIPLLKFSSGAVLCLKSLYQYVEYSSIVYSFEIMSNIC